jgi:phosphomannomutase
MALQFGTSGLRGLVTELTPALVADYIRAFVAACPMGTGLWVARDLRASSPEIAAMVVQAAMTEGLAVTECGVLPTPALALAAMGQGAAAVMVTGSHIPADRNGLKFYVPTGEIAKVDEAAILANLGRNPRDLLGTVSHDSTAGAAYVARYRAAYGPALTGRRIGVYSHSAAGRDILCDVIVGLGAQLVELGRSATFVPVDTEAVEADTRTRLRDWVQAHALDAIVSTDGDGDRPLVVDEAGVVIAGDVLGQITGAALGASVAVTPVSSNTGAEQVFDRVLRTRIGSPYVIAGMDVATGRVVGYEANGGFLLGFVAKGPAGVLKPLMTRDALLPILATLVAARHGLAALVAAQPARFTAQGRLQEVTTEKTRALVAKCDNDTDVQADFLASLGGVLAQVDRTDGLRMTLQDGRIVHLRPSGNAPELRFYAEAVTRDDAAQTLAVGLAWVQAAVVDQTA